MLLGWLPLLLICIDQQKILLLEEQLKMCDLEMAKAYEE
jgi:hypothetical protein